MISAVVGLVGVAYVSWLLADRRPSELICESKTSSGSVLPDEEKLRCVNSLWMLDVSSDLAHGCGGSGGPGALWDRG